MEETSGDFDRIFIKYDTDKATHHTYGFIYDQLYPPDKRLLVKSVLEIGVYHGGSMYGWRDYFPEAHINGLDVNPTYLFKDYRISTYLVDANDGTALQKFAIDHGPWDLIVDDGPHDPRAQITAVLNLWQFVAPGGYYVIEDILADQYFNIMNYYSYFPGTVHDFRHISNIRNDVMLTLAKGQ